MRILLFGGTTEGRLLAEALASRPVGLTVSVATEYGHRLLPAGVPVLEGRLSAGEISALIHRGGFDLVIDAVHPYAAEASANIRDAAKASGTPSWRVIRRKETLPAGSLVFPNACAASTHLSAVKGNILLTTGGNSLESFTRIPDYRKRLYVRVLPAVESIQACLRQGIAPSHIFAMQGPFSAAFNVALMRHWSIGILVTKESGKLGGFPQKVKAAAKTGAALIVIGRPANDPGMTLEETLDRIDCLLEESP